jgi:hypothetical protein
MRKFLFVCFTLVLALALTALPAFAQTDTDGDGVLDANDACPLNGDAGNGVAADGCPILVADGGDQGGGEAAAAVTCAGSLPPRLAVGDRGQIAERFSTVRQAAASLRVVRVMYARDEINFTVLEGPVCTGNGPLVWYRVEYDNGVTGWSSESQVTSIYGNNRYWLEPEEAPVS